jgi:hypothetical protein
VAKSLYFLRSAKRVLTPEALKAIYYSLIHCHLVYGIQIWSCTSTSNYTDLVIKQKNAIRIISLAKYNAHTESLFKKQQILPLPDLVKFFKLQFVHRFVHGYLPSSLSNMWITIGEKRNRDQEDVGASLRNDNDLYIPLVKYAHLDNSPIFGFPKMWNNFGETLTKSIYSKLEFNQKLKYFFLEQLAENYVCNRLLCPHCHL